MFIKRDLDGKRKKEKNLPSKLHPSRIKKNSGCFPISLYGTVFKSTGDLGRLANHGGCNGRLHLNHLMCPFLFPSCGKRNEKVPKVSGQKEMYSFAD